MLTLRLLFIGICVAFAIAEESTEKQIAEIVTEVTHVRQDGYDFLFRTSDGVSRKEEAKLITVGDHQGIGVKGSYSYIAPDGLEYVVTYTADDKGFKPQLKVVHHDGQ